MFYREALAVPAVTLLLAAACAIGGDSAARAQARRGFHVEAVYCRQGGALILTKTGNAFRLELPPILDFSKGAVDYVRAPTMGDRLAAHSKRPKSLALRTPSCVFLPTPGGLWTRCDSGERLMRFGGFPVTAVVEYRGRIYVGTRGGGVRTLDAPKRALPGMPRRVESLGSAGGALIAVGEGALYLFDGLHVAVLGASLRS